jgi:putative serine/threonine protein kinase
LKNLYPAIVPVEQLSQDPYASVLCFPKPSEAEVQCRIEELTSHGVTALEFSGKASVYGVRVPVLGKGFVGIVVVAYLKGKRERVAVKIRRTDADRADLLHEAIMLSKANITGVAPKLIAASKNFLLMQLIDGDLLPAWLKTNTNETRVKQVLSELLRNCCKLDEIGLDHGELSKAPKHVIVDKAGKPWIVDFETASDKRKTANLPAICHFLFTSPGEVARAVTATIGERNREEIISAIREYKRTQTLESFDRVLQTCLGNDV